MAIFVVGEMLKGMLSNRTGIENAKRSNTNAVSRRGRGNLRMKGKGVNEFAVRYSPYRFEEIGEAIRKAQSGEVELGHH